MLRRSRIANASLRALLPLLCCTLTACASSSLPPPVDPERARESLKTALDAWKSKQTLDEVRTSSNITVQDDDWSGGWRLVSYTIKGPGQERDSLLRCPVELVLQSPKGQETRKSIFYLVTTSPQITIFREVFPQ